MSILGNSSNVVLDNAKLSNAGRDVITTTQHSNSVLASSSDQVIVMEQPNVLNAGGNITYITWNFQLLEVISAALSLAFSPFRSRTYTTDIEPQGPDASELSSTSEVDNVEDTVTTERFPSSGREIVSSDAPTSCITYTESMLQKAIGYPLWFPQPTNDLPIDYRRNGVSIGDVGIITFDGDFDFLFNVLKPAKNPINIPADLPDEFDAPTRPEVRQRLRKSYPNDASTLSNLQNLQTVLNESTKEISFWCSDGGAGAILSLPQGASENDLRNEGRWKRFIAENALSWYRYALDNCDREIDRHSLYFITGYMKSKTWGISTFDTPVPRRDNLLVMEKSTRPNDPPYVWKRFEGATVYKSGPSPDPELASEYGDNEIENQCLFLRGFKIALSEQAWKELWDVTDTVITNQGSHHPAKDRGSGDVGSSKEKGRGKEEGSTFHSNLGNSIGLSNFPTRTAYIHPSNIINDALLSLVPAARIAITHDSVWMNVAQSKNYEINEMLPAIFGSQFVASYFEEPGMCTFEPVKILLPMFKHAGSLSDSSFQLHKSLTTILDNWIARGMASDVADFLEIITKILMGTEKSGILASMNDLALKYYEQDKWAEVEDIQFQILMIQAQNLGKEHLDTLTSMNKLALIYKKQGNWAEAEQMYVQLLKIHTRTLGEEHPDTLDSMNKLGVTYFEQAKWIEAENIQIKVLEIYTRVLGNEHPDTLASMNNLSSTYYEEGNFAEVENIQAQVLEKRTKILGKEHPDTLSSMNNLAVAYYEQGKYNDAENIQTQVVEMRTRVLGEEHLATLSSMDNLALAYFKQDKCTEAVNIQIQVLEIRTRVLGREHPSTLDSMNNLAAIYHKQSLWADAASLELQVVGMRTKILGRQHPDTLTSMYNLAIAYYEQGKWTDAANLQHQVLEMRARILELGHPDTLSSIIQLTQIYKADLKASQVTKVPEKTGKNTGIEKQSEEF